MAKTRNGAAHKSYYSRAKAENIAIKNRRRKLTKLIKEQPNNLQLPEALANVKYRRKTPGVSTLTKAVKKITHLVASCKKARKNKVEYDSKLTNLKYMYSIGARFHD